MRDFSFFFDICWFFLLEKRMPTSLAIPSNPTVLKAYPIDSSSPIPTRGQTTSKHIDETLFSNDMRLQQRSSQTQYNPLYN
ncbi:hypothetical protein CDAR_86321 [Caerostris darwini]|uniref:Uncharacterized protein n=1 Tax=Caerostris darwini TaxID=1538125 RepID=A0AAV4NPL5_9ARAC|nr:hypothetical protein CDAR_86321 [Caerostris darwini]